MTYKAKLSGANESSRYVHSLYVLPFNNVTLQAALNRNVNSCCRVSNLLWPLLARSGLSVQVTCPLCAKSGLYYPKGGKI